MPLRVEQGAVVVPQRAVIEIQGTFNLAVVGADSTVEIRPVQVGTRAGTEWVVTSGVVPGEQIVVEGVQKVRQGSKVRPTAAPATRPDSAGAR